MLHVRNFWGNVVMVLCICPSLKPPQSCRFLGFEHLISSPTGQKVMSSVDMEGLILAVYIFIWYLHVSLPSTPKNLPLSAHACLNLNLLLFIAFACLKNRHPLLNCVCNNPVQPKMQNLPDVKIKHPDATEMKRFRCMPVFAWYTDATCTYF